MNATTGTDVAGPVDEDRAAAADRLLDWALPAGIAVAGLVGSGAAWVLWQVFS